MKEYGKSVHDKQCSHDPFRGISIGSLVRIIDGPSSSIGKHALVVGRDIITDTNEEMHEEYDANFEVMVDGRRMNLWVGWVERVKDQSGPDLE